MCGAQAGGAGGVARDAAVPYDGGCATRGPALVRPGSVETHACGRPIEPSPPKDGAAATQIRMHTSSRLGCGVEWVIYRRRRRRRPRRPPVGGGSSETVSGCSSFILGISVIFGFCFCILGELV